MEHRTTNLDSTISACRDETHQQCNVLNQSGQEQQNGSSWRSLTVLRLGCQGLLPQDIARETGIPVSTVYRYYWVWFGKRRAQIARRKQAVESLIQLWQQYCAESEHLQQP